MLFLPASPGPRQRPEASPAKLTPLTNRPHDRRYSRAISKATLLLVPIGDTLAGIAILAETAFGFSQGQKENA
jgi:hypothetical protein